MLDALDLEYEACSNLMLLLTKIVNLFKAQSELI